MNSGTSRCRPRNSRHGSGSCHCLPPSASTSCRIASAAKQVRHDPGTVLLTEGAIPETLHFLLDGRVIATGRESAPQAVQAPAALGFTEALSGMPMASTIRTDGLAVTLAMSRSELRTLLADNTDLVNGLFATLSSTPPGVSGTIQTTPRRPTWQLAARGLTPVEKVLRCSASRCSRASRPTRCATLPTRQRSYPCRRGRRSSRRRLLARCG